jgi:hypothetical protein
MRIKSTTYNDVQQKPCQFYWQGLLHITIGVEKSKAIDEWADFSPSKNANYWGKELRLQALCALLEIELKCILLLDAGKSPESISEYLFLSRNTVANYSYRGITTTGDRFRIQRQAYRGAHQCGRSDTSPLVVLLALLVSMPLRAAHTLALISARRYHPSIGHFMYSARLSYLFALVVRPS